MTRKKSNVKALALAVTCAILAGGYSGLNPVYAADKLYKDGSDKVTTTAASNTEITELTVGGVTLGNFGTSGGTGRIEAANVKISNNLTVDKNLKIGNDITISGSDGKLTVNAARINGNNTVTGILRVGEIRGLDVIDSSTSAVSGQADLKINGTTFKDGGAITATSLKLTGTDGIENVGAAIKQNAGNITVNANAIQVLETNKANVADVYTKEQSNSTFAGKAYEGKVDALDTTVNDTSNGLVKKVGDLEGKTTNILYDATTNTTTVNGIKFHEKNITDINNATVDNILKVKGKLQDALGNNEITVEEMATTKSNTAKITYDAGTNTTYINQGDDQQVVIDSNGLKVGKNSSRMNDSTGFATTKDLYVGADSADAPTKNGSKFYVDGANGDVVSKGSVTANQAGFNDLAVTNGLTVGSATGDFVNMQNGNIVATGSVTAMGDLAAVGNLYVSGQSTFTNGVKTDKIEEATPNAGVTVDGVVLKDKGINAADGKFTVNGATGDTAVGGTLNVTGDTTLGGNLGVTGNATVGGTLNSKGNFSVGDNDEFTVDASNGNVVSKGSLTSSSATIGTVGITNTGVITGVSSLTTDALIVKGALNINGDITGKKISGDSLEITGNGTIGGSLGVTGAITGATINGATITTDSFNSAKIGATTFNGVTLTTDGDVSGRNMTASGTVTGTKITDGAGASMNAGTVAGTKITDGVATMTGGNLTGVNSITASGNITSTSGTIKGVTLTDGVATMNGGKVTAKNGVEVNANNYLDSSGLKTSNIDASKATIGNITVDGATITSNTGTGLTIEGVNINNTALGNVTSIDGVSVGAVTGGNGLQFGGNAVVGATGKPFSSTGFNVDDDGDVTGKSFNVNGSNYLDSNGLTAKAATIGGVNKLDNTGIDTSGTLHVGKEATFGNSTGTHTIINGGTITSTDGTDSTTIGPNKITTKTLEVKDIILHNEMKDGTGATINIKGSDGSMSVASDKFKVDANGQVTNHITATGAAAADTIFTTSETGIDATFQKNGEAASSGLKIDYNHAALNASGGAALDLKDKTATLGIGTDSLTTYTSDAIESKVGTDASRTLKATEIVDAVGSTTVTTKSGGTTFGDGTANNTLINGSIITSTNGGTTGVLNGSNLTLTNGANSTALTAGGVTFTGADGRSDATGVKNQTTIDGGIITTDTLNVQRIELGDKLVDSNGTSHGSNLSMDEYGNIKAAGGKFTVAGTNQTNPGTLHNEVGKTSFDTTKDGARMSYAGTVTDAAGHTSNVTSNVSVGNNNANVSAGASSIEVTNDGITNTGKTTFNGAVDGSVPTSETTIDGNTIKTGHLITDKLTITGSGNADGTGSTTGSIAFGGNGSITSNIKDGTKEATFKTDETGTFTKAEDGAHVTTNTVNAQGNTNEVTDGTNTSTATQTATSIGGVVTNGTVKMRQELTADGVKVSVDGDPANYTQITNKDVSITDPKNTGERIKLSDLGQLKDLDGELTARSEYTSNPTAVGAINAEAGIRREEVARLDNRIDDVNNRVDKVGAMAAAIASLKSIGYDPQAPSEFSIGLGQYKGETGVAMGFFHYPNKNFMINVSLSTAGGETMGGIGATWRFGHKSPQKLLEEQREAQARKELAAAEKYQAAAKLAKEAQERAEYAAKLARQAQVSADNAKAAADATQAKHFQ